MSTRILIADDHGVLRAGLRALLSAEPGLEILGEAKTGEEAIAFCCQHAPDVVLLDVALPDRDGLQVTQELKTTCPATRVLILTASEERSILTEALRVGASGYVVKRAVESELVAAIAAVMRGDLYVDPAVTRWLLETTPAARGSKPEDGGETLTPREQEILVLLCAGMTNAQVAEQLTLRKRTVESHRANIMTKLHLHGRADLVRYAAAHGLLSDRPLHLSGRP